MVSCSTFQKDFEGLSYKSLQIPNEKIEYKESLNEKEFQEEVLLVRYALEKAYGAKGTIANEIFVSVDKDLKQLPYIDNRKEFCQKLGETLSQFPDFHLQVRLDGELCYKRVISKVNVGKNLNDSDKPWKGIIDDNIYTIAISQFPSGRWPGFFEFTDEAVQKGKAIVIDLRGNGGGDDSIAFEMAEKIAGQKIQIPFDTDIKRNAPETLILWANNLKFMKNYFNDPEMSLQIDKYLEENEKKLNQALAGEIDEFTTEPQHESNWNYDNSKGFKGPIYILQDKECRSSGESSIDFFEYFPNVTRVGFNTVGMIHFGNVGLVVLPYSGLHLKMPTKANRYKDGRFIEFTGIKPDIFLEEGQDAYQYVLGVLKK